MSTDIRPLNAKGKRFSWSFSAINDFDTCPYQYAAKRFYCTVDFTDTVATIWGSRAHTALENRLKHGTALPEGMEQWEQYCRVLEAKPGLMLPEQKICFNLKGEPVSWFAKDAWARGMIDVLIIDGDTAYIYDWKTGKKKDNQLQLETFVWFVAHQYPEVENFVTRFIWLKEDIEGPRATGGDFTRSEHLEGIELKLGQYLTRMSTAWREKVFQPKESGLCRGWCPVEECRFHKEKR